MTTRFEPAGNERGSALLMSLVLIFVMTVLGLALFDLGVVESRLVHTSQADARAFEIAQAGVERALRNLQDTYNADLSWASGSPELCSGGSHRGCSDDRFRPAASGYISNLSVCLDGAGSCSATGSYSVEFMQVPEETLAIPCEKSGVTSDVASPKEICRNLIFVRSTGTLNSPGGYSPTRTIQLLVRATLNPGNCLICGGLTGAAATGTPINGNVKVAGSILIAGHQGTPSLSMGGGAGQTNSYAELDSASLQRISRLPLVCPIGVTCSDADDLVESLGATLKVALPTNTPAVTLSGTAKLGQNGDQTYSADGTRKGKGPLDGIFVADGCSMPCTDNFTGVTLNSSVFVDGNNITKPYQGPAIPFPQLTGPWTVFGVDYDHFACPQGSSCTPPGSPTTQEYFVSRAANLMTLPSSNCVPNPPGCGPAWLPLFSGTPGPLTYLSGCPTGCPPSGPAITGLGDGVGPFEMSVSFIDQTGSTVNGKICWDRAKPSLPVGVSAPSAAGLPRFTLEFGSPNCDTPAPASNPLLLYMPSSYPASTGFTINRFGGPNDYNYRGSAIIVTNGLAQIEESLQNCQTTANPSACYNSQGNGGLDLFTRDSSLTVMTIGNMNLGKDTSSINRIMGMFYTGCDPADSACGETKGLLSSQKQTNIAGVALGYRLCFAGGASPCSDSSGGNVPSFFQVIPDRNNLIARIGRPDSGSFIVSSVLPYWVECKRTPGDTLPTRFSPQTSSEADCTYRQ